MYHDCLKTENLCDDIIFDDRQIGFLSNAKLKKKKMIFHI